MSEYISSHTVAELELAIANGLAGGAPSGTYANLAALTAAIPAGNTKIYVTLNNGYWNYWNGTAWTAGASYAGTGSTVAVGTTATGSPGTSAAVTNSGTPAAAVFNFTIPKGVDGAKGDKGDAAATVSVGTTTTGAVGSSASVINSGTSSDAVFDFTVPRGATGGTGATGKGISSIVRTSGTGAAGTTDTYTITFTDSTTATFNVVNGANGIQGIQGTIGLQGIQGIKGDIGATGATGANGTGVGDMLKTTYDTNNSGVVDNAEKVNGLTVLTAVPSGAIFTDTTYSNATQTVAGLESAADKIKLDGLNPSSYVKYAGGTMTGPLTAQTNANYTTAQMRNTSLNIAAPTSADGNNGDVWIVYA